MSDALNLPTKRFLFVEESNGVLYLTVGRGSDKSRDQLVRSSGAFLPVLRNTTSNIGRDQISFDDVIRREAKQLKGEGFAPKKVDVE
jgi:hypothetical protein